MTRTAPVSVEAHAKINLTLEVLGKRADGYHNLVSIMQTIDLHDTVELAPSTGVSIECDDPALGGEANLALRAAAALKEAAAVDSGVHIRLEKRIPVASGLGGGSSDAAAVLIALNQMWKLDWPVIHLQGVAISLGADVPFFLYGGTALVQGKGEDVVPLPRPMIDWLVVLAPEIDLPELLPGMLFRGLLTSFLVHI